MRSFWRGYMALAVEGATAVAGEEAIACIAIERR
jgi:hypothetical protein